MQNCFAYIRISPNPHEEKATQENQEMAIKEYISKHDISIKEYFYDLDVSGNETSRPSLDQMRSRLDEVDGIVVYDSTRLSRNFIFSMQLMIEFKEKNKIVHFVSEGKAVSYDDDLDQLITLLKSWFGAYERKKIKERQKLGIKRFKDKNNRWGRQKKSIDVEKYKALMKAGLTVVDCSKVLGVSRTTIYKRIKEGTLPKIEP